MTAKQQAKANSIAKAIFQAIDRLQSEEDQDTREAALEGAIKKLESYGYALSADALIGLRKTL